mmetsp:Transcript_13863/g.20459  ORF Transcript_13863/g.20459 Transcript_13863/m.20459 type:complete len:368 (+) Transcript_13863:77-1180(+)
MSCLCKFSNANNRLKVRYKRKQRLPRYWRCQLEYTIFSIITTIVLCVFFLREKNRLSSPSFTLTNYQEQGPTIPCFSACNGGEKEVSERYLVVDGYLNPTSASALIGEFPVRFNTSGYDLEHIDEHKFWSMFGKGAWRRRKIGEEACFSTTNYWQDNILAESSCQRNWYEDGTTNAQINSASFRPPNGSPPLLGPDTIVITQFSCDRLLEQGRPLNNCKRKGIVHTSMEAGYTILRLGTRHWNMCRNLEWVVCSIRGMLPGQKDTDGRIHFVVPPSTLDVGEFLYRNKTCRGRCDNRYKERDIYMMEVSVVSFLCKNRDQLFQLEQNQTGFYCDFDEGQLAKMVEGATSSRGGLASDNTAAEEIELK